MHIRPRLLIGLRLFKASEWQPQLEQGYGLRVFSIGRGGGDKAIQLSIRIVLPRISYSDEETEIGAFPASKVFQAQQIDLVRRNRRLVRLLGVVNELIVGQRIAVSAQTGIENTVRAWFVAASSFVFESEDAEGCPHRSL